MTPDLETLQECMSDGGCEGPGRLLGRAGRGLRARGAELAAEARLRLTQQRGSGSMPGPACFPSVTGP